MSTSPELPRKRSSIGLLVAGLLVAGVLVAGTAAAHGWFAGAHDASWKDSGKACRGDAFEKNGSLVTGLCLSFTTDPAAGTLSDITLTRNGTTTVLLTQLSVPSLAGATEKVGRAYSLRASDAGLLIGPMGGSLVASRNGTHATLVFPADAVIVVHPAVEDWSPAGATITYGDLKANLVLPRGSTLSRDGQSLTIDSGPGPVSFQLAGEHPGAPFGHGPMGHGPFGGHPMRHFRR